MKHTPKPYNKECAKILAKIDHHKIMIKILQIEFQTEVDKLKQAICEDYKAGMGTPTLSKKYGVKNRTIQDWIKASGITLRTHGWRYKK